MSDADSTVWGIDIAPTRIAIAVFRPDGYRWSETTTLNKGGRQYDRIRDALRSCEKDNGEPSQICIEQPALPFVKATFMAGAVCARLEDAIFGLHPHVIIRWMQPSEWRKWGGLSGRASKDEVMEFARNVGFAPDDQDQADAGVVALARWNEILQEDD
jgi:hypothetical protein